MPLRVINLIEPFTRAAQDTLPVLALSKEYDRLYRDLVRYTNGEISGRSYLIAGHRGSGKTMLVHKAIEDLLRDSTDKPNRPLFVRLHGPDLLPPLSTNVVEAKQSKTSEKPKAESEASPNGDNSIKSDDKSAAQITEAARREEELITVLKQMLKNLFRVVTSEFSHSYRQSMLNLGPGLKRDELIELAGQFDLEMDEALSAARLRYFWNRIGKLDKGILFAVSREKPGPGLGANPSTLTPSDLDSGIQEILTLTLFGKAYQQISGELKEQEKQNKTEKDEMSSSLSTAYALKNLLAPVVGLVAGGVVTTQIALNGSNPIGAILLGLVTGATVSLTLSYTRSRTRNKEASLESVFIKDRSVQTLSGVLPLLVQRLRFIGLHPVFVVDELDKVEDLEFRMEKLVQHLKYLITENSFSCFLTDRRYLNALNRRASEIAYAAEYTYFSDRLLVLYRPDELRKFVEEIIESTVDPTQQLDPAQNIIAPKKDQEDKTRIAYVVLHRSRLHPIDLRRQIDRLAAGTSFTFSEMFPEPGCQFEMLMQAAIEWLLNGEDVQAQLAANPDNRQVVYDSLYYVSRLWEDASNSEAQYVPGFKNFGSDSERKPGFELCKKSFIEYLDSRIRNPNSGKPIVQDQTQSLVLKVERLSNADSDFLFVKVTELVRLLCDPTGFKSQINASPRFDKPPSYILNSFPTESLLEHKERTATYVWLYDMSGRYLRTREIDTIIEEVADPIYRIEQLNLTLDQYGVGGIGTGMGLQTMSNLGVLPTIDWRGIKSSIDRLNRMMSDPLSSPYGRMVADRDRVTQFARTLEEFEPNIKGALLLAAALAPEVSTLFPRPDLTPNISSTPIHEMLVRSSQYLQLSASKDDDLRKINGILNSPSSNVAVNSEDPWQEITNFVLASGSRVPFDQTLIGSAWKLVITRLSQHFRDGTLVFDPQIEDIVTSIKGLEPGRSILPDLSLVTAAQWTTILHRIFTAPPTPPTPVNLPVSWQGPIPPSISVAAALELGLFDLAERLIPPAEAKLTERWVRDVRLRNTQPPSERRNVLVIRAEQRSLCEQWKPSQKRGALVGTAPQLSELLNALKQFGVNRPPDVPIDIVCVELTGDRTTISRLASTTPISAVSEMSPGVIKDLEQYLVSQVVCYFAPISPQITSGEPRTANPFVLSPKSLDDLIEHLPAPQQAKSS